LTPSHSIVEIINTDYRHIDISAGGMNQVIPPDGNEIAISGEDHNLQLWIGHF